MDVKVLLLTEGTVKDYVAANARSKPSFTILLKILKSAEWNKPVDITTMFRSADILGKGSKRVVSNIGGNNYRMICRYSFGGKHVRLQIRWIGTHAEYDELCKNSLQYTVRKY